METDEIETVNRRDAVAGLGLLGVLLAALVGTIVYRIENPSPAKISVNELALAPASGSPEATLAAEPPAVQSDPTLERDANVSSAAFNAAGTAPADAPANQPTFVAPGQR